jgi:hypothetical protein
MKASIKKSLLAGFVVMGVAGCANEIGPRSTSIEFVPLGTAPRVDVQFGTIVVAPEPLVADPATRGKDTLITWRLPKDSPFRFPTVVPGQGGKDAMPGIQFEDAAAGHIVCRGPSEDRMAFSCMSLYPKSGKFRYVIRLQSLDGKKIESDPTMVWP